MAWNVRLWGHLDDITLGSQSGGDGCRVIVSVPGPLQSVQRAELWGVILALQACTPVFVGVDNKNVVNHVGNLLSRRWKGRPFPLVKDGDLLRIIDDMIRVRGYDTVRVCKVKGHATEDMVARGRVRREDMVGNNLADEAADLGRRRQTERVTTARRICVNACHFWYPLIMDLHRYFIAVARIAVNHDPGNGTAPDPTVWCIGAPAKKVKSSEAVCEFAAPPGPDDLGWDGWCGIRIGPLTSGDFDLWPYSPGLLVKFSAFLGSLHWPVAGEDLVIGGVSFIEILILYELWAGERLVLETAVPKYLRRGRSITVTASFGAAETVIWRSCRFVGALFRALRGLPGGLKRFVPGRIGGNHCRLRRIGWEQCGHGLSCRPQESRNHEFLDALLVLFGYEKGAAGALVRGSLRLRYCKRPFARLFPTWSLPCPGHVAGLVTSLHLLPAPYVPVFLIMVTLGDLENLGLEELEVLGLEELEALVLEELEVLVLEELEAPWFGCLEELEALVGVGWLEDLEAVGNVMRTVASSEFGLPGKPPLPGVFPPWRSSQCQRGGKGCGQGVMRLAPWS